MTTPENVAVLTGDLIGSRRLSEPQRQQLFHELNQLWHEFAAAQPDSATGDIQVFRGDGWQALVANPQHAVNAAIFVRASVKALNLVDGIDTRIGVGIGSVDSLNPAHLGDSNGPAFIRSGEALDSLANIGLAWALKHPQANLNDIALGTFPIMDLAIQRWTKAESAAVVGTLLGLTQDSIAKHPLTCKDDGHSPSRQAISDALKRIGWSSHWQPALQHIESRLASENS